MYSLTDGLTALGAYGIIVVANNIWYESFKNILYEDNDTPIFNAHLFLLPVLGIAYITGFLVYIILNSEIILVSNLKLFISLGLVLTIAITQFRLIWNISSYFIKDKELHKRFTPYVCGYWGAIFFAFSYSPDVIKAVLMLLIQSLPIVSKYIVPKLSSIKIRHL